jgi:hypothetical protein
MSNSCVVACQHDVVRHMMQKPILSGRLRQWAYSLVEYDLEYEPLRATKAQIVADFIVDHGINVDDVYSVTISP